MKKFIPLLLLSFGFFVSMAQSGNQLRTVSFDGNWRFKKDSVIDASPISFDDSKWRALDLPHDWSIEDLPNQTDSVVGPFTTKSVGTTATGYTVGRHRLV
jgi:beta-galactosidase